MSTAITNAQRELKQLASTQEIQEAFRRVLGENAGAFIASMLTAVNLNDNLKYCAPMSVINCAMLAASLDLPIEQNLGQAWIIPYKDKGVDVAQFQIGYKGLIQLALRTGEYETIYAGIIPNGVTVRPDLLTGKLTITGEPVSDEAIGYVGTIEMRSGYSHTVYMTRAEVEEHAKKYSKSWGHNKSPWSTHFDEMAKKTVIKKVLTKYGILSVKMNRAMTADTTPMHQVDTSDLLPNVVDVKAEAPRPKQSKEKNMEQLTGQVPARPWSPEYIREKVQGWMMDNEPSTDNQRKVLAAVLDKALSDKTKRYEVCEFLTGSASTADMRGAEATALLNWLGVARFEDAPSDAARAELAAVHTSALKAKGQMELAGVA